MVPTDWGELRGTEGTRDVVHAGRRQDWPIAVLSFPSVCNVLLSRFYSSTSSSLEKGDWGWRGGGGGQDGFAVDYGEREREEMGQLVL